MNKELEQKINGIINAEYDLPFIFKSFLKKELEFYKDEEILSVVHIAREYVDKYKKDKIHSRAKLLVATTSGLSFLEEGETELEIKYGGYRVSYIMYSSINSLNFDTCFLQGTLGFVLGTSNEPDLLVQFNTATYYDEIESFVDIVRRKMIEIERRCNGV